MPISKQTVTDFTKKMGIFHLARFMYRVVDDPRYIYYHSQGKIVDLGLRERARALEKRLFRRAVRRSSHDVGRSVGADLRVLRNEGLVRDLEIFSAQDIAQLTEHLRGREVYDPTDATKTMFDPLVPAEHARVAYYDHGCIARAPCVMQKANHPYLLKLVGDYFGCAFRLSSIDAWWSYPQPGLEADSYHTQTFHRDFDSLNFLKFFVYLTDVDADSGPHVFVTKSHRADRMIGLGDRYTDNEVNAEFGGDVLRLVGPKGTAFLANTFALHKGDIPRGKKRLILQFSYSVNMALGGPRAPLMGRDEVSNPDGYAIDPYVNRRFVRS